MISGAAAYTGFVLLLLYLLESVTSIPARHMMASVVALVATSAGAYVAEAASLPKAEHHGFAVMAAGHRLTCNMSGAFAASITHAGVLLALLLGVA